MSVPCDYMEYDEHGNIVCTNYELMARWGVTTQKQLCLRVSGIPCKGSKKKYEEALRRDEAESRITPLEWFIMPPKFEEEGDAK